MRLDLNKLHAFVAVARAGSLTAAARGLHLTPSAVSHALRKLQDSAACQLFEWRGRNLTLTAAGAHLYEVGRRALEELEAADRRLSADAVGLTDHLVLGSTLEFGSAVLLRKLKPLLAAHPELHIDFYFSNELQRPLQRDEIDLAVDCRPHLHPAVHRTPLFRERYVVVATPTYLAQHPLRSPLDLQRMSVLSLDQDGSWWNSLLRALPSRRRPHLGRLIVINHVRGLINGTLAGYGVGLLPKYAVLEQLERGALVAVFPRLRLLEDTFCIYQKLARTDRPAHRLCTSFLLNLDLRELGDAIGRAS
jgi:DNA-binding transcriptional LysR family regulator